MRVRVYMDIEDRTTMRRIAHAMLVGGFLYGNADLDSPRPVLMERMRQCLTQHGIPFEDPEEWNPDTVRLTARLWRKS